MKKIQTFHVLPQLTSRGPTNNTKTLQFTDEQICQEEENNQYTLPKHNLHSCSPSLCIISSNITQQTMSWPEGGQGKVKREKETGR